MADLKGGADSREEVLSDYRVYHLTGQEWIRYLLEGTAVCAVTAYVFYRSFLAFVLMLPAGMLRPFFKRRELCRRRKEELRLQFKEAIQIVASALAAGYSVENAFIASVRDLEEQYGNHGIDARYTGPHEVAPTMSARYGTGGNNVPLVSDMPESYCIAGNIIDREVQNGGNGLGCQPDISYTLTSADRHAVFSRQRSDEFLQNRVTATQSARQHKDATDLVCEPYQNTVGTIGYTDHKGINNQYVSEDKCIVENRKLIRRLTPLECERLQGFPDHWTDIPGASDSARYKALGNSVAIPCVDFVLRGIAYFLRKMKEEKEP